MIADLAGPQEADGLQRHALRRQHPTDRHGRIGYGQLLLGRLLQGLSAGLIGVVVPLYLAECLGASTRGKGTGIFQWLLTLGIRGRGG